MVVKLRVSGKIEWHDDLHAKVKDPNCNSGRHPRRVFREGDSFTRKDGKWRHSSRLIDKNENRYVEVITDKESGEVVQVPRTVDRASKSWNRQAVFTSRHE